MSVSESRDLIHWAAPVQILRADEADPPGTQPYSMTAHWYGSHYVGLVSIIRDPGAETEDIRLATSRDGVNWKWVGDRSAFLPLGQKGDWDRGMLFPNPSVPFIIRGNEMLIYYCAYSNSHGMKVMFNDGRTGWLGSARNSAIGLAKLRLDGFVSVEAGDSPGTLTTKSFFLHGNEVFINAACKGEIRVGLLDPEARAVEGFLVDDCEPITCDQVEHPVRWKAGADLSRLMGRRVKVMFKLKDAKLYSFSTRCSQRARKIVGELASSYQN